MWESERVKSKNKIDVSKLRRDHLEESKKISKILDFYYRVLFNIDGIREKTISFDDYNSLIEKTKSKLIEQLIASNQLPPFIIEGLKNPNVSKLGGTRGKLNDILVRIEEMMEIEIKEKIEAKKFIKMDLPNFSKVDFWQKLANFTSVSLTDSRINLISHETWCDIFKGIFKRVNCNTNKEINEFIMSKFNTSNENKTWNKITASKSFDIKNKNKVNALPEYERSLVMDYKENGPFMNMSVISDIYDVLQSIEKGKNVNQNKLSNVKRYLRVLNGKPIFLDEQGYAKEKDEYPIFRLLENGEMEIEFEWPYDIDERIRNVVKYNPHEGRLEEFIIVPAPLCYTNDGKLLEVRDNNYNNFIYKYISLFRNVHAHDAYSVYLNPNNGWYVCESIDDDAELQYSIQWLECLMNNLVGNLDQILYGPNSENQGSSRFFDVKPNRGTLASNNEFTIALKPYLESKMSPFRSKRDFVEYLNNNYYINIVINDDISLNKAKNILREATKDLSEKYAKHFAQYQTQMKILDYSLRKDGKYVPNAREQLEAHEAELWNRVEKQLMVVLNQRLSEKFKLKNYEITPYPIRLNTLTKNSKSTHPDIRSAINYIAERASQYGLFDKCFDLEEQMEYINQMSTYSMDILKLSKMEKNPQYSYEGLNVIMRAANESLNHLGGDILEADSLSVDLVVADGMDLYKSEVARFLGVYSLYNSLIETGYADAVANSEIVKWELDKKDEENIAKLDMKYLNLYRGKKDGNNYPINIKTNEERKRVLRTLRDSLAHGNVFIKEPKTRYKNDKDIVLQFCNANYINGEPGGYMVESNICSIMAFSQSPVFTTPTKHTPFSLISRSAKNNCFYETPNKDSDDHKI